MVKYTVTFDSRWTVDSALFTAKINNVQLGEYEDLGLQESIETLVDLLNDNDTNIIITKESSEYIPDVVRDFYFINEQPISLYTIDAIIEALDGLGIVYIIK